ncbi:MAG: hypothetical protein QOI10_1629 [Solirubrobacterales bacterium]|nr:hypothetical protein [Solirubrobacterales bacterium]
MARALAGLTVVVMGVGLAAATAWPAGEGASRSAAPRVAQSPSRADLANGCVALRSSATDRFLAIDGDGYAANARRADATPLYLKPTALPTYLIQDSERTLIAGGQVGDAARADTPGPETEWRLRRLANGTFTIASTAYGTRLVVEPAGGALTVGVPGDGDRFRFAAARGCARYPEARVGARGRFDPTNPDGSVSGFADVHLHITANLRAGGSVIYGEPFDRLGVTEALGHDADVHGPDGSLDVTGNLLRTGEPTGTHDTDGWPSFAGWPVFDTYTHQQTYYMWLKRVWKAGMRLVVAQTVEDQPLCEIEPVRTHSCDEMETIKLEIEQLRALQDYVDAQSGGRGRGWLRIVTNPFQARRVIEQGKLAVVIGMEASNPFGCSELQGVPQCTREDVDAGLSELRRLGLRSMFITHWIDNAFGGAAFEEGAKGDFIKTFEVAQTGHPFATEPCGDAGEAGGQCNAEGLTDIGAYLVRRMIAEHMLIETDHLSQKAREAVFEIAEEKGYPLVSSHTGTGGEWTAPQLKRLYELGGLATVRPGTAPEMAADLRRLERSATGAGGSAVALGTDTGGFSALPGPRPGAGADPLHYPFKSFVCDVRFVRQRTGERTYDLNVDGVAHYGLIADLVADIEHQPHGRRMLRPFFRSAEAYLEMWEGAYRRH